MARGTVKWFNNAKGFGFICPDNGDQDVFAHYSTIDMTGYKFLKQGQPVTFEAEKGSKGSHAINVVPLPMPDDDKTASNEQVASAEQAPEKK